MENFLLSPAGLFTPQEGLGSSLCCQSNNAEGRRSPLKFPSKLPKGGLADFPRRKLPRIWQRKSLKLFPLVRFLKEEDLAAAAASEASAIVITREPPKPAPDCAIPPPPPLLSLTKPETLFTARPRRFIRFTIFFAQFNILSDSVLPRVIAEGIKGIKDVGGGTGALAEEGGSQVEEGLSVCTSVRPLSDLRHLPNLAKEEGTDGQTEWANHCRRRRRLSLSPTGNQ